ncbi:hypothetical protein [Arthrobacter sp. ISL-69]|uniref:hypothetical protein n=1 Tax=Arthrobacter sp. ISL-69 TaxID=2819113 RepID=UPI001BEA7D7C|nr:hypothetical protein [Arthrobacter sp. ISL-69]MBT2535606.1 hypothetical protein [Arthrobacter sp. ISL-69]
MSTRLRHYPPFVRFRLASTVSDFGTYITGVALSVFVLVGGFQQRRNRLDLQVQNRG